MKSFPITGLLVAERPPPPKNSGMKCLFTGLTVPRTVTKQAYLVSRIRTVFSYSCWDSMSRVQPKFFQ